MKTAIIAAIIAVAASAAHAQQTSTSTAQSYSGVHSEGDNIRSSTAVAPSNNSTAPCVIGQSGGIGLAGIGISAGGGKIDRDCVTRQEAQILAEIATMRGEQRRAAVMHFCTHTESMQRTMVALGWCVVGGR